MASYRCTSGWELTIATNSVLRHPAVAQGVGINHCREFRFVAYGGGFGDHVHTLNAILLHQHRLDVCGELKPDFLFTSANRRDQNHLWSQMIPFFSSSDSSRAQPVLGSGTVSSRLPQSKKQISLPLRTGSIGAFVPIRKNDFTICFEARNFFGSEKLGEFFLHCRIVFDRYRSAHS